MADLRAVQPRNVPSHNPNPTAGTTTTNPPNLHTASPPCQPKMSLLLRSFLRSPPAFSRTSIILRRPQILAPGGVGGCSMAALVTRRYHVCWKLQYRLYVFFLFFFFSFLFFLSSFSSPFFSVAADSTGTY